MMQTCMMLCSALTTRFAPEQLKCLQEQDATIETLKHKLTHNKHDKEYYSIDENGLLTRKVIDSGHEFCTIYLPAVTFTGTPCSP